MLSISKRPLSSFQFESFDDFGVDITSPPFAVSSELEERRPLPPLRVVPEKSLITAFDTRLCTEDECAERVAVENAKEGQEQRATNTSTYIMWDRAKSKNGAGGKQKVKWREEAMREGYRPAKVQHDQIRTSRRLSDSLIYTHAQLRLFSLQHQHPVRQESIMQSHRAPATNGVFRSSPQRHNKFCRDANENSASNTTPSLHTCTHTFINLLDLPKI